MAESVDSDGPGEEDCALKNGARIQDVARHAGVAIGTVSNVLNYPDKVAEGTRLRVEAAIAELGFVRNSAARTLASRRTDTGGLVVVDIGNSLFVDIARGSEAATSRAGLKLLLANSDVDRIKQDNYLELFDEARVAGGSCRAPRRLTRSGAHRTGARASGGPRERTCRGTRDVQRNGE
jgi:hypothetical protein